MKARPYKWISTTINDMVKKQMKRHIHMSCFAFRMSPDPMAWPTREVIEKPNATGTTNVMVMTEKTMTIADWFKTPMSPLIS